MTNVLDRLHKHYNDWEFGFYHENLARKYDGKGQLQFPKLRFLLDEIRTTLFYRIYGRLACKYFGHGKHFHSEDWAGPDSGGTAGYCDRCGFSFDPTFY